MCEWGKTEKLKLVVPSNLSRTGKKRLKVVDIDSCITPIVKALNEAGILTVACCCGHGRRPGNIALADGRELIIAKDFKTGRIVDKAFDKIH